MQSNDGGCAGLCFGIQPNLELSEVIRSHCNGIFDDIALQENHDFSNTDPSGEESVTRVALLEEHVLLT
jgi:hypothetical protein